MDEDKKRTLLFVALAAVIVLGALSIIISCIFNNDHTYVNLWVVPLLLIAPLPNLFVSQLGGGPFSGGPALGVQETGKFLTGMLVASVLILPFFILHLKLSTLPCTGLAFVGTVFICLAVLFFQLSFNTDDAGGM